MYNQSNMALPAIKLQPTGIEPIDEILSGGIPTGSTVILSGTPGTGKTIFAQQWLFCGYKMYQEPGLYLAFTESTERAIHNLEGLGFYDKQAVGPGKVHFLDLREIMAELELAGRSQLSFEEARQIIDVLRHIVDATGTKRIVIDSLTAFVQLLGGPEVVREFIFRLGTALSQLGATIVMTSEASSETHLDLGVEEYIADGIIRFVNVMGQQAMVRQLRIVKLRGSSYRTGPVIFDITAAGIEAYPKIPSYTQVAKTEFSKRLTTGSKELDSLMKGGIPQGHMVLVGGNTGTGKSTLGMQFIKAGLDKGETCVYLALEEPVDQIIKTADQHGWNFVEAQESGKLIFITADLIDVYPDKLLYEIVRVTGTHDVKRVVFDSVSTMENAAFDRGRIREFLMQLVAFFKSEGITCCMTYLTTELFGGGADQLMSGTASTELGLSSIVDGIVLLRYVERDGTIRKLLSILKLRGSDHEKRIMEYEIGQDGVLIGEAFKR